MTSLINFAKDFLPFGEGFSAGTRYWLVTLEFYKWGFGAAHDSISKVVLELGIPGIVILIITLLVTWKQYFGLYIYASKFWKNKNYQDDRFLLTVFLGAQLIYLTLAIPANSEFASGSWSWITMLLTLQILISLKPKSKNRFSYF